MHVPGVPLFLQRVPVLGGLLRGISVGAITRLMEDINQAVEMVSQAASQPGDYRMSVDRDIHVYPFLPIDMTVSLSSSLDREGPGRREDSTSGPG